MKKLLKILTVTMLTLAFSSTLFVNARELPTDGKELSPEERFEQLLFKLDEGKENRLEKANEKFENREERRNKKSIRLLETVSTYTPELLNDFEEAIETHDGLHNDFYNKHIAIREAYYKETMADLIILKEDLMTQVEAGEITYKEAGLAIQSFLTERRESLKASFDNYRETISDAAEDWKVKREEVKALVEALKLALEAEDLDVIESIIHELYDYALQHLEFDQYRLDTLNSMF